MIVVDVGCAKYDGGKYDSMERLLEMFDPDELFGFDPNLEGLRESAWWLPKPSPREPRLIDYNWHRPDGKNIWLKGVAMWTHDGQVGFRADGLNGWSSAGRTLPMVPCIDVARFIGELPEGPVILKLDCEGAEYELLRRLHDTGEDARLTNLLVEWHGNERVAEREEIEATLRCPYEEWRW